jgi:hypothetical protein
MPGVAVNRWEEARFPGTGRGPARDLRGAGLGQDGDTGEQAACTCLLAGPTAHTARKQAEGPAHLGNKSSSDPIALSKGAGWGGGRV